MTAPAPIGFPDWGRFAARATKLYRAATDTINASPVTFGPFFVGDVPHLSFRAEVDVGATAKLVIFTYRDLAGGGSVIGHQRFDLHDGGRACLSLPVIGPWVTVEWYQGPSAGDVEWALGGTWTPFITQAASGFGNMLLDVNSSVGIGLSATTTVLDLWPGEATVSLQAAEGPARAILKGVFVTGTAQNFVRLSVLAARESVCCQIYLPQQGLEVERINDHSSAQNIRLAIVARPLHAGR